MFSLGSPIARLFGRDGIFFFDLGSRRRVYATALTTNFSRNCSDVGTARNFYRQYYRNDIHLGLLFTNRFNAIVKVITNIIIIMAVL